MSENRVRVSIDISWTAILKVLLVALGLSLAMALRDVIFMLFLVFIFVAGVSPVILWLQRYMSRTIAVLSFFIVLFLLVSLLFYVFVPLLIHQLNNLLNTLPALTDKARSYVGTETVQRYSNYIQQIDSSIVAGLNSVTGDVFQTTATFFGGLATVLTGLILSFYLLLEEKNARDFFHQVLPHNKFKAVYTTIKKISLKMGDWIRGQLLLMLIIGVCNFVAFFFLGIPSPLALGIWAGICEIIPYFGPVLAVIPALFIALATGNYLQAALVFIINFILIQQVEANIVVPKVMGRAVGLSPVLVILSLAIGLKLFGLVGAIVSLPAAAIISVVFGEWASLRQLWEKDDDLEDAEALGAV